MTRHVHEIMDAITALREEWGALAELRERVRAARYDDDAERDLIARLQQHQAKLGALRQAVLADVMGHPRRRRSAPMRTAQLC